MASSTQPGLSAQHLFNRFLRTGQPLAFGGLTMAQMAEHFGHCHALMVFASNAAAAVGPVFPHYGPFAALAMLVLAAGATVPVDKLEEGVTYPEDVVEQLPDAPRGPMPGWPKRSVDKEIRALGKLLVPFDVRIERVKTAEGTDGYRLQDATRNAA